MIQTIAPLQYFPISRVLPDPSDNTTYYVKAIVRNGATGATLATVLLLPQGSQIYSAQYRAPALASSTGLFLTITTTVYTDAGYTTPSQNYGNDQDTFQVFDSTNLAIIQAQHIAATVAGSIPDNSPADVNYKKIEKIVLKALESITKELKSELDKVHARFETLDTKTDLQPILDALTGHRVDISGVLEAIEKKTFDTSALETLLAPVRTQVAELHQMLPGDAETIRAIEEALKELKPQEGASVPLEEVLETLKDVHETVKGLKEGHGELAKSIKDVATRQKKTPLFSIGEPGSSAARLVTMMDSDSDEEKEEAPRNTFGRVIEKEK